MQDCVQTAFEFLLEKTLHITFMKVELLYRKLFFFFLKTSLTSSLTFMGSSILSEMEFKENTGSVWNWFSLEQLLAVPLLILKVLRFVTIRTQLSEKPPDLES